MKKLLVNSNNHEYLISDDKHTYFFNLANSSVWVSFYIFNFSTSSLRKLDHHFDTDGLLLQHTLLSLYTVASQPFTYAIYFISSSACFWQSGTPKFSCLAKEGILAGAAIADSSGESQYFFYLSSRNLLTIFNSFKHFLDSIFVSLSVEVAFTLSKLTSLRLSSSRSLSFINWRVCICWFTIASQLEHV